MVAVSLEEFARELRRFDDRRRVVNELRRELRKPIPKLRTAVRANAIATLPSSGGLGAWVARAGFSVRYREIGRAAGVRVKVSRKAIGHKADLKRLDDAGRIRHPLYGNRKHWYPQSVTPRFFTKVWDRTEWLKHVDEAFDRALDEIRRG